MISATFKTISNHTTDTSIPPIKSWIPHQSSSPWEPPPSSSPQRLLALFLHDSTISLHFISKRERACQYVTFVTVCVTIRKYITKPPPPFVCVCAHPIPAPSDDVILHTWVENAAFYFCLRFTTTLYFFFRSLSPFISCSTLDPHLCIFYSPARPKIQALYLPLRYCAGVFVYFTEESTWFGYDKCRRDEFTLNTETSWVDELFKKWHFSWVCHRETRERSRRESVKYEI